MLFLLLLNFTDREQQQQKKKKNGGKRKNSNMPKFYSKYAAELMFELGLLG